MGNVTKNIGGTGITAGGDVTFGDVSGQVAIGQNITQTQTLSASDKKELLDCLIQFQKEAIKLGIPEDELSTVNGDLKAAIKEAEKEKPDPSKIKSRFEGALDTDIITCMALREAGEHHHDNACVTEIIHGWLAGHIMTIKERHYEKVGEDFERVHKSYRRFHQRLWRGGSQKSYFFNG